MKSFHVQLLWPWSCKNGRERHDNCSLNGGFFRPPLLSPRRHRFNKKKSELCDRGNCLVGRASDVASGLICGDLAVQVVMKTAWFGSNRRFAMSALKPLALGILVWAASGTVIRADPITWPNNFNWVAYFAGQNGSGDGFSPTASAPMVPWHD